MAKDTISVATTLLDTFTDVKVKELIELRPWMKTKRFILLTKQKEIEEFFDKCIEKGRCSYDLETTGLNTRIDPSDGLCYAKIVGICVSHDPDEGAYIPIAHEHADNYNVPLKFVIRETKRLAANCRLIFHNFKYDGAILKPHGVVFDHEDQYEDTYLMAAIQDASRKEKGLKHLSGALLDRPQLEIDDLGIQGTTKNIVSFYLVPPQKAVYYGGGDAMNTMALYLYLKEKIDQQDPTGKEGPWAVYNVEKRCLFVTMEMENNLVKIDRKYLEEISKDVDLRMQKLISDIYKIAGHPFDINSTKQLGVILFEELGIPYPTKAEKTKRGEYQTNSEILEMISSKNPIISLILTYRGYVKIKGTYLDNWLNNVDENDEAKFKMNQIQADTGRFSGSGGYGINVDGYCGVNCQNIPTWDKSNPHSINLRRAMVAHDGFKMLSIDYSGEELRIATNFSREPKWVNEFLYGTGDLHTITGKIITGKSEITKKERSLGKCVAKGTLIASERGWIPIENLKVGDMVISHTGELRAITDVWDMGVKPGIRIETKEGNRITCGLNHRFLSIEDEWVRAEDLKLDQAIKSANCIWCQMPETIFSMNEISSIELIDSVELWDLTVSSDHTYIAQGLVTHNTVNFLTMYGGGAGGFAAQAKIPFEVAKKMILNFFKEYEGLNSWIKREWKASRNRGYSKTMLGRRRPLEEFYSSSDKGIQSKGDRCAINSAIQGCLVSTEKCLTDKYGYQEIGVIKKLKECDEHIKVWTGTSWEDFDVLDRGSCQLATIELSNGMILHCDTRHEVLVVGKYGYEFRHFEDLDEDTEICVSIPTVKEFGEYPKEYRYTSQAHNGKSFIINTQEQWNFIAYLMGYVIGDGGIRTESRQSITLCFGVEKLKKYFHNIETALDSLGLCFSGLRKNKTAKGESYQVHINSKGLVDLFIELGYIKADSGDKRVPEIINRSPASMRKAFIKGYFDTDGCKKRRNRYGYHTPNLELLRDVQLVAWTLGLPSNVRNLRNGNFKLEWQDLRRFEEVMELPHAFCLRRNVCNDMLLPEFLRDPVKSILQPAYDRKDNRGCDYYSKLNTGKNVTLAGVVALMGKYNCQLPEEVYYHYKLKKKTVLDKVENTYTLSVHSDLHRFDSAGIISKNTGADVIKIALWRVYRWIKDNGLENDVKILLPVHDEVLYEVRAEKLDMIVPELCRLMKIRDVTDKLKWVVPLDVDAEYGDSFHVDHDYWKEMKAKMKETPTQAPEPLVEEVKPESPEKPESVKEVAEETQVKEEVKEITHQEITEKVEHSSNSALGVTTNNTPGYYQQMVINGGYMDNVTTKERVHNVLDNTEEKSDMTLFRNARIEDNIDKEGFFNYKIDINLVSAQKIRFIMEVLRSSGNMFTGPKNRICLISKDGEVFYKSKDELSIDSFIALCIVFNV